MLPDQTAPKKYKNTGLFVDYFLGEKLPKEKIWQDALADHKISELFERLKALYDSKKKALPGFNEAQTEDEFIRPVFELLGFAFIVQTPTKAMGRALIPDYALFADSAAQQKGYDEVKNNNYINALAVADAKYWGRPLDKTIQDARDTNTHHNPTFQISSYLIATKTKWAVLTNGSLWRLYSRDHSQTMGEYYQSDLAAILESGDFNDFLYFYLFFRKVAFTPTPEESFLDMVVRESIEYGAKLQENLKKNIFEKIFIDFAKGFVAWRRQNGIDKETPQSLKEIFDGTLILLYRLLFILYAESRDLLPVNETAGYYTKSLAKIRAEIKQAVEGNASLSQVATDFWDDLINLYHIIDAGDPALNIPKYNGGLFSRCHTFLEANRIADYFLAKAVYKLTTQIDEVTKSVVFIDYRSLGVKQLGSIYEGLLEFHLNVADRELAVIKEKGKERYVPLEKLTKSQRAVEQVTAGDIYLENTKAERKATGSYYTPDYIVKYIVENTVSPLIDDIEDRFGAKIKELKSDSRYKGQSAKWKNAALNDNDPALNTLALNICDPAMGSGHFLVSTVDYIAARIYGHLTKHSGQTYFGDVVYESPLYQQVQEIRQNILVEMERQQVTIDKEKLEDDKVIIRRMVMKRCIFGVDLNYLAVELSKLSLWLNSFTVGAPLSFLDHHLRWGNSLIGSSLEVLASELKRSLHTNHMAGLFGATAAMIHVGELTDSTIGELEQSQTDYQKALALLKPYKQALDLYASDYFGNKGAIELLKLGKIDIDNYESSLGKLSAEPGRIANLAQETRARKRFFHWELEFPEVFYDKHGKKEDAGFDAVIGNPPYVRQEQLSENKPFLKVRYAVYHGVADLYVFFYEAAHRLVRPDGFFGMITSNKFMRSGYGAPLRTWLENNVRIKQLIDFGDLPVFAEVAAYPVIFISANAPRDGRPTKYAPIKALDFTSLDKAVNETAVDLPAAAFAGDSWSLASGDDQTILQKMKTVGVALGDYIPDKIQYGIKTGLNAAFFIDQATRDRLIAQDPKSAEIIKPLLVGEDIGRYAVNYKNRYLIWTYIGVPIDRYPAIFAHLKGFQQELEKRWDKGEHWWELRACDYYNKLEQPKIIFPDISATCRFAYDDSGAYLGNTAYFLPEANYFLLSLLNSSAVFSWYGNQLAVYRGGYLRFFDQYLRKIPIRRIAFTTQPTKRQSKFEKAKELYFEGLEG